MAKNEQKRARDFVVPLNINGLQGRMLHIPVPAGKSREILFVYGHHSSIERWWGVIQDLNQYGAVTVPDLPGFGGMDSFYKIGQKPTLDNLADYLATFIKLRYKRKRVTIVGLSFGFVIATRMLQRYPDLTDKVDLLVSVVGFARHDDFTFSKNRWRFYRYTAGIFSHRLPALFFRNVILHPAILRLAYARTHNAKQKFAGMTKQQRRTTMDFEIHLWHCNDVRTYMLTTVAFLKLDNCTQQVNLPVWHISVKADQYFNNNSVEQHMRIIFSDFHAAEANMDAHAPTVIADMQAAAAMIPKKVRSVLDRP